MTFPRGWTTVVLALSIAGVSACSGKACPDDLPDSCPVDAATPSFVNDVFPIIQTRCQKCHRPTKPRDPDLGSYDAIYAQRRAILYQIYSCTMPNDGSMTSDERTTVMDWFVCGAPNN